MLFDRVKDFTVKIMKHVRKRFRRKTAGRSAALFLAYISLFLSALAISVVTCAQSSRLYLCVQEKCGLFEGEKPENRDDVVIMNESVVSFLSGRAQYIENASERANLHMQDVKRIFDWTWKCGLALLVCAALLIVKGRGASGAVFMSLLPVFLALIVCALFVFSDFTKVFYRFHEIAFDNDLWLLSPREDLLIRCLPEEFFYRMALIAAARALFMYFVFCLMAGLINKFGRRD
ncbi:MAG: TIGR01906 family membrane protein [Clostridia bacterium]|nr:TIGR01906 family membrane protein [Clostridia bacterium]